MKLIDKLWNWGQLAGCHNKITGFDCKMSPAEFAEEYGIKNAFIVSYDGNIMPPFSNTAKDLTNLNKIIWSVLGDGLSPLPEDELGYTKDILDIQDTTPSLAGGVVDDFFSPERMKRFPPEVLKRIKQRLNEQGLSFWCVLYNFELDMELEKYMECFDGITFWIWQCDNIPRMDEYLGKLQKIVKDKPVMLGVYLMDFSKPYTLMNPELFEMQLQKYFGLLENSEIEGIIFCSSTVGDAPTTANKILKQYIKDYGEKEIG